MSRRRETIKRRRPGAVTLVGTLIIVSSLVNLSFVAIQLWNAGVFSGGFSAPLMAEDGLSDVGELALYAAAVSLTAGASLITGVALLRMHRWAWAVQMTLVGLILLIGLIRFIDGSADHFSLLINAFIAFVMNQQEVREAFGVGRQRDAQRT